MKRNGFLLFLFLLVPFFTDSNIAAQKVFEISVQADKPGAEIQPAMWGVFFEDINFAADGGIYAELVKNRSFEFELPLTGWQTLSKQNGTGRIVANFYSPSRPSNPHYMRIYIDPSEGSFSFTNEGYRGMGIRKDEQYNFSVLARLTENSDIKIHGREAMFVPESRRLGGPPQISRMGKRGSGGGEELPCSRRVFLCKNHVP